GDQGTSLIVAIGKFNGLASDSVYLFSNLLISTFRNATGSLCPAKPKWPLLLSLPGWGLLAMYWVTLLTSASTITVPFSSTLMCGPWTVTSSKFHSPTGRR